jgi:hypothetical protein
MKAIFTAACVASLVLVGTTFAGPHSSGSSSTRGTTASSHRTSQNLGSTTMTTGGRTAGSYRNGENLGNKGPGDYHHTHGHRFGYGYFYEGRGHYHWSDYRWSSQYGCYTYFCPSTTCWYYWSEPTQCYYPMSYAGTAVPTRSTEHLDLNVNNSNNNNNSNVVTVR